MNESQGVEKGLRCLFGAGGRSKSNFEYIYNLFVLVWNILWLFCIIIESTCGDFILVLRFCKFCGCSGAGAKLPKFCQCPQLIANRIKNHSRYQCDTVADKLDGSEVFWKVPLSFVAVNLIICAEKATQISRPNKQPMGNEQEERVQITATDSLFL